MSRKLLTRVLFSPFTHDKSIKLCDSTADDKAPISTTDADGAAALD